MRRLVLHMMMSVDGFVASTSDESWMVPDPERDAVSLELANQVDLALVGHGVYRDMVGYRPTAQGETETQRAYIARINPLRKLVVSHNKLPDLKWNATTLVVAEDGLADRVRELKSGPGGDIVVWGGGRLVRELAGLDLIDEYQLIVQPVALGQGQPLFGDVASWRSLRLQEIRGFVTGAVFARYSPKPRTNAEYVSPPVAPTITGTKQSFDIH